MITRLLKISIMIMAAHCVAAIHSSVPHFSPHLAFKWLGHVPISMNFFLFKNAPEHSWRKFFNGVSNGIVPSKEIIAECLIEECAQRTFLPAATVTDSTNVHRYYKLVHYSTKLIVFAASASLKVARGKSFTKALKKFVIVQLKNKTVNYVYKKLVCCVHSIAQHYGYESCDWYPEIVKQEHHMFTLAQFSWHMVSKTVLHWALDLCLHTIPLPKQCNNQFQENQNYY